MSLTKYQSEEFILSPLNCVLEKLKILSQNSDITKPLISERHCTTFSNEYMYVCS